MKRFIAALTILICISGVITYLIFEVKNITNEFVTKIDAIVYSCDNAPYEEVEKMTADFVKYWKEKEAFLTPFVRHEHIDQVSTVIAELENILDSDMDIFKSKCSQLIEAIEHLHHSEFPLVHQ